MSPSALTSVPAQRDPMRLFLGTVRDLSAMDATDLDGLLSHIVEVACEMTAARYGAMAVLTEGEPARLSNFITHGMTDDERLAIGALPVFKGILGRLLREPVGFRVEDLTEEPDAAGFPPGHPVMHSFLAMPIRIGSTVFGNLYLTEKAGEQPFSEQDEVTVEALTVVAGGVIDLTRRRLETQTHRATSDTIRLINRALLVENDPARVLLLVLTQARQLRGAEAAAVLTTTGENSPFSVVAAEGASGEALLDDARARVLRSVSQGRSVHWTNSESDPAAPVLEPGTRHSSAVPVRLRDETWAVLLVRGWLPATAVTSRYTEDLLEALGDQVGLVLDSIAASDDHDVLRRVDDRERIARDLHDLVIQRIFATGLTLQGAIRLEPHPGVLDRIERSIAELDATIRDLRATIFALTPVRDNTSVHDQVRELMDSYTVSLGFPVTARCDDSIGAALDPECRSALLLVLREALSNVARHARASDVDVDVGVHGDRLVVVVTDNGVGVADGVAGRGLDNVRARARERGGSMDLLAHSPSGTMLRWQVPLR
ncbi:MAG: GAF domain-containing protein [Ornithinimicrobium sp.]